MAVRYEPAAAAWPRFPAVLRDALASDDVRRVCELGGGARPAFTPEEAAAFGVDYAIADVSAEELAKAPDGYQKLQVDLTDPALRPPGRYDLVFSKMLVEHLSEPAPFHRNVAAMLTPGGHAFHFFPTLYSPTLLFNHLLPDRLTERVLAVVQPGLRDNAGDHGKFPTHYEWCRGPTRAQLARFASVGFEVEEYVGFFGHDYYRRVPPLQRVSDRISRALVRRPVPLLTTYAQVLLRRP